MARASSGFSWSCFYSIFELILKYCSYVAAPGCLIPNRRLRPRSRGSSALVPV